MTEKNNSRGSVGIDTTCSRCPRCGGYPIRVDMSFDISKEKRKHIVRGQKMALLRERRTYYHCQCGACTTGYYRPLYDKETGCVKIPAWQIAKEAYKRKIWTK